MARHRATNSANAQVPAAVNGQPAEKGSEPQIEILSDTTGVDLEPYKEQLHAEIRRNWQSSIQEQAEAPVLTGVVTIRFTIHSNGEIDNVKLEASSGKIPLDRAAWYSIAMRKFPALPKDFQKPQLELRAKFSYRGSLLAPAPAN